MEKNATFGRMEKIGNIEIRIFGTSGNKNLNPDNFDIKHIAALLQNVEGLLYPNNKKHRPLITYELQTGSIKHIFKTSIQSVIGFNAVLEQVQAHKSIDFLDLKTARALENIQKLSFQKNYEFQIKTSLKESFGLTISPATKFNRSENNWVEAELYFYGILTDAGGKNKANIHLDTEDHGYLSIEIDKDFLKGQEENILYKNFGVKTSGMQNAETGEIDTRSLKLLEFIDYHPKFDQEYLNRLISKAKKNWSEINPEEWLYDLRGEYEA